MTSSLVTEGDDVVVAGAVSAVKLPTAISVDREREREVVVVAAVAAVAVVVANGVCPQLYLWTEKEVVVVVVNVCPSLFVWRDRGLVLLLLLLLLSLFVHLYFCAQREREGGGLVLMLLCL